MMSETHTEAGAVPSETVRAFLNAARDGYVDTAETRFNDDGSARIVLTHTHQGAFRSVSKLARRFGFIPEGNRDAGGQTFRHISGTTPTLNVQYHADRYNVVMVGNSEYTGPLPYDPSPLKSAVTLDEAVDAVTERREGEDYRDDVEYRVQSCETQEPIAVEDEREDDGDEDAPDVLETDITTLDEGDSVNYLGGVGTVEKTGTPERFCADCEGMVQMAHVHVSATFRLDVYRCPHCGGRGVVRHLAGTPDKSGVVRLSRDAEDARLMELREDGVPAWVSEREDGSDV